MAGVLGTEADDGGVGLSPPWLDEIDCEVGWGAAFYLLPITPSFVHIRTLAFEASKRRGTLGVHSYKSDFGGVREMRQTSAR